MTDWIPNHHHTPCIFQAVSDQQVRWPALLQLHAESRQVTPSADSTLRCEIITHLDFPARYGLLYGCRLVGVRSGTRA